MYNNLLKEEIGDRKLEEFMERIRNKGCNPKQYVFIPVHPWQWVNFIIQIMRIIYREIYYLFRNIRGRLLRATVNENIKKYYESKETVR